MKRIKYLIFTLLLSIGGIVSVSAASLSVGVSNSSVTVGGTVKVTVSASGADAWEYCLDYDSSVFKLTNSTADSFSCVRTGSIQGGGSKVTFTLKALKQGSSKIGVRDYSMLDSSANDLSVSAGSKTVTVKEQSDISTNPKTDTPLNDNAYLKSLEVVGYTLSPAFDKKTQSYEVEVPNDVSEVGINAFKEDPTAIISANVKDIDHIQLTEGINKIVITVRAQKGNKLEYVINIKRDETNPIVVTIDGKEYTVLRDLEEVEKPKYYTDSSLEIEDQTIASLTSDVTGYTLVALKDEEGNISLFSYNDGKYEKYFEVVNELVTLIPKEASKLVNGFEQSKEIDINGNKVTVYYNNSESDFVLLYAMNVGNGETSWYTYDIKEGTLQRYNGEVKVEKKGKDIYFYLAIAFAIVSALAILIIFIILWLNNRLKNKNDRLYEKLKEKKVKVVEHPVFDLEVDSWKDMKVEEDDGLSDTDFFRRDDEDTMSKINEDVDIREDAFDTEEVPLEEENKEKKRKKKDKKKEKEEKEAEEAELKAMRDDFLKTRELEITKEMKTTEDKKSKKKAKKKKK